MINLVWLLPLALLTVRGLPDGMLAIAIAYAPLVYLAFRYQAGVPERQAG